ncbi:MAG: 1,4-dihydroxy-2-naphthoate octaprenyltransferase [Candidatus Bipolaricaulota bacterium]
MKKSCLANIKIWITELRAPFFTCTLVPVFLGVAVAWRQYGVFHLLKFILTLLATLFLHAGANMIDDYFDYQIGADRHQIYDKLKSPFFGGSRVLNRELLQPRSVYIGSIVALSSGGLIGIYLAAKSSLLVLLLGAIGLIFGYYHVTVFSRLGMGEFSLFLNFGPLITGGSYLVQTGAMEVEPFIPSIPVGILMAALLLVNGIPDREADREAGKLTLPVRIGPRNSLLLYVALLTATYVFVGLGVLFQLMPLTSLLGMATAPLALWSVVLAFQSVEKPQQFTPVNRLAYLLHFFTGLLLILGYISSNSNL